MQKRIRRTGKGHGEERYFEVKGKILTADEPRTPHSEINMDNKAITACCERLIGSMLNKQHIEDIEDDRYSHVVSRSQSRFSSPISSNRVLNLEFHPSGHYMAYSREDGSFTVWRLNNLSFARSKKLVISNVMIRWFSWNFQEISEFVTCSGNHELLIWGVDEKKKEIVKLRTLTLGNKNHKISKCVFDPRGRWLLSQHGLTVDLWDVKSHYELKFSHYFERDADDVIDVIVWNNSGSHLIAGFRSGHICILKVDEGSAVPILLAEAHRSRITSIIMDPWGRNFITGSEDGTCNFWELATGCCQNTIDIKHSRVCCMDLDSMGKILAITTADKTVQFYDFNSRVLLGSQNLKACESDPLIKFYPNKSWFILSGKHDSLERHFTPNAYNDIVSFWKLENDKQVARNRTHKKPNRKDSKERGGRISKWDFPKSNRFNV